jgi:hypothetical protein
VAICARRNTVSRGHRTARSIVDATKLAILQLFGLRTGSRLRWVFRKSGDEVEIKVGNVDVRKVMGIRCVGIR